MMKKITNNSITLSTAAFIVFATVVLPSQAHAAWRDRSDELPGLVDDSTMTTIIVVGVVALVGILLLQRAAANSADDAGPDEPEVSMDKIPSNSPQETSDYTITGTGKQVIPTHHNTFSIRPAVNLHPLTPNNKDIKMDELGVTIGFVLEF